MRLALRCLAIVALTIGLVGCQSARRGGVLRLKHVVTVATPQGERVFSSVLSLDAIQTYNHNAGGAGWGGISCRLTGDAVHVPTADHDFYFLLTVPRTWMPAWYQMDLIKKHFGLPNHTGDDSWIAQWKSLASSSRSIELLPADFPAIAMTPRDGWMNDARLLPLTEAADSGLHVLRYRLEITRDPVGADPPAKFRYKPSEGGYPRYELPREYFSEVDGTA